MKIDVSPLQLKVCGMRQKENLEEVFALKPDYIGLIFYQKSPRYFEGNKIDFPKGIQKVGVFVNESFAEITRMIYIHQLEVVQIHGDESEEYCTELKKYYPNLKIWKAFSVGPDFEMEDLPKCEAIDAFLFDTKGANYGGNGVKFNWEVLKNFPSDKEIVLSGGITVEDVPLILEIKKEVPQIKIIDINSRFEVEPGLKNIELVKEFSRKLSVIR